MMSTIVVGVLGAAVFIGVWHLLLNYYFPTTTRQTNPEVLLLAPTQTYHLRWAPLVEFHPYMAPEPQAWESATNQPIIFQLKNLGASPVQDIHVEWAFEGGGSTMEMILHSPYTRPFSPVVNGDLVRLSRGNYSLALGLSDHGTQTLPYLIAAAANNHVEELPMPEHFSRAFKMRLIASQDRVLRSALPLAPDVRRTGPTVSVILSWGPSNAKTAFRYRVRSEVKVLPSDVMAPGLLNIGPPYQAPENLRAHITFTVESIN